MIKENITTGINIGFALLISSILTLRFNNDIENTVKIFKYFIPILIGYILIGIALQWLRNLPPKEKNGGTGGVGALYWLFIIMTIITFLANFTPSYIRYIVLVNIIVVIILWAIDYRELSRLSEELNGVASHSNKTLIIDLEHKPKTKEEFFDLLEQHYRLSKITLEYIEKDIPAIVKLNGVLNKVEIGYYYGYTGIIVYTLKITQL